MFCSPRQSGCGVRRHDLLRCHLLGENLAARIPPARSVVEVRVAALRTTAEAHDVLDAVGIEPALREAQHQVGALVVGVRRAPADALVQRGGLHGPSHHLEGGDRFLAGEGLADPHRTDALDGRVGVRTREVLVGDVLVPVRPGELSAEKCHRARRETGEQLAHRLHHRANVGALRVELSEYRLRITARASEMATARRLMIEVALLRLRTISKGFLAIVFPGA